MLPSLWGQAGLHTPDEGDGPHPLASIRGPATLDVRGGREGADGPSLPLLSASLSLWEISTNMSPLPSLLAWHSPSLPYAF